MKTVVVVNPQSQGGKTGDKWSSLREKIFEQLGAFDALTTTRAGHATALTRDAIKSGAERVIALGGDGTLHEVVNGFFDGNQALAPHVALGILPAGTGGDFIRSIPLPRTFDEALARIKAGNARTIDVGRVTYRGERDVEHAAYFINIASFGISGLVDRYVNQSSKKLPGKLAFGLATLKAGVAYKNADVDLRIDDNPARDGKIYTVAIANGQFFGGGMHIAPNAALDDGQFDVVVIGDMRFGDLLLHGLDLYRGTHLRHPKIRVERARTISVTAKNGAEVLLDVDGEQLGCLPARFTIVPAALKVCA